MKNSEWGDMGQLRVAAENVADAIELRTRVHNRIRSGSADTSVLLATGELVEGQLSEAQIKRHPLGKAALEFEKISRDNLQELYKANVPQYVRDWASTIPILKSGELFPRIVAMTGNPAWAVPLKMEGTGKDRKAVPDGEPYERSLRQFWQWTGRGDPDLAVVKGDQASLLKMGKVRTVSPLLFVFSSQLVKASGSRSESLQEEVRGSELYKHYAIATREARGHDGKCESGKWPYPCAQSHVKHYQGHLRAAAALERELEEITDRAERQDKLAVIAKLRDLSVNGTCRNRHIPPLSPNGCGIGTNPEWGDPGAPWRPGHVNMHGHRIVQKELLRQFWSLVKNH